MFDFTIYSSIPGMGDKKGESPFPNRSSSTRSFSNSDHRKTPRPLSRAPETQGAADLNLQPLDFPGAPGGARTPGLRIRQPGPQPGALPTELHPPQSVRKSIFSLLPNQGFKIKEKAAIMATPSKNWGRLRRHISRCLRSNRPRWERLQNHGLKAGEILHKKGVGLIPPATDYRRIP